MSGFGGFGSGSGGFGSNTSTGGGLFGSGGSGGSGFGNTTNNNTANGEFLFFLNDTRGRDQSCITRSHQTMGDTGFARSSSGLRI